MRYGKLRGKWISQPQHKKWQCHVQERHSAFYKYKTKALSHFSPTITRKYLFIFGKLEEDNMCLSCKSHPLDESSEAFLMNPRKEWFSFVMLNETYII